ncbi:methylglyoxal reductase (NADPH-dependent) gre2 [Serendipita sp. 405]|nr:methylglyoxal reductase (NADPH-dependent) gre2 [Serendipita sp. 405]
MSKILVTGGNGFVAAQVLISALTRGHQVVATVRNTEKGEQTKQALSSRVGDKISNLSFAIVPSIEAEHAFDEVIKNNSFHAVVHTATPFYLNAYVYAQRIGCFASHRILGRIQKKSSLRQ